MAHAMTYEHTNTTTAPAVTGWLAQVRKAFADYRLYRATLTELASLSDRELADLGLSRFVIRDVAYDSVYR